MRAPTWPIRRLWTGNRDSKQGYWIFMRCSQGPARPGFAHLPDIESFARSEKERRVLSVFRATKLAGSLFFLSPGTPMDRVKILQDAMRKTFRDPEFLKEYEAVANEKATPLMPETMEQNIREIPAEPDVVGLLKRISGADPLPAR